MGVHHIKDKADLEAQFAAAGDKLVVIDFFASWCGPCKFISPKIEELSNEETNVIFLKIDVDECEDVAAEYEISSMPTFVFWKNGQKLEKFSGANEGKLKEIMAKLK